MPDATPVRPPLEQAIEEGLAAMFRQLQSEVPPASLIGLADDLEAASRRVQIAHEARTIDATLRGKPVSYA